MKFLKKFFWAIYDECYKYNESVYGKRPWTNQGTAVLMLMFLIMLVGGAVLLVDFLF